MKRELGIVVALCALTLGACSTAVNAPSAPEVDVQVGATETGGVRRQAVTIRATVEKVDAKARKVSLLGYDGTRETLTVGDEVKNLPQVRKGDEVVVTYYQAVAFEVLKKGDRRPVASMAEGMDSAEAGQMPAGAMLQTGSVVVDVVKLDPGAKTAVLRGPEGNTVTVDIQNPAVFQKVKVGDKVEIRMSEALAINVERAAKN